MGGLNNEEFLSRENFERLLEDTSFREELVSFR